MNLVLIETSGNQRYIFATNKLRENVGASELTYQVGTIVVREAVKRITSRDVPDDLTKEPAIENTKNGTDVEVIIATSGKALLLVRDKMNAKEIVKCVTRTALEKMPGITVHGAICKVEDDLSDIHNAVGKVHRRLETIRYQMPSNEQRFLRLPFVAPCATSGLPANIVKHYKKEEEARRYSQVSVAKSDNRDSGYERIKNDFRGFQFIEPEDIDKCDWIAVIHADGNGVGEIFLKFDRHSKKNQRDYINYYRIFSNQLDACTKHATSYALQQMKKYFGDQPLPIVPLVLGGDDLTVICDGQYALKFTYDFLTDFESQTSQKPIIKEIARNAFGVERLGICAGIAIIKPHYPFHQAYELAEQLLKSAKQVKKQVVQDDGRQYPCSALDFHIVYDSTSTDLDMIREERLTADEKKTKLYAKPYVVTDNLDGHNTNPWLQPRKFEELKKRVEAMIAPAKEDSTRRALPNSKLHEIRQALFRGKEVADAEAKLIENRLSSEGKDQFDKLKCEGSIFFGVGDENLTHFLDAIEVVDFWKGFHNEDSQQQENSVTLHTESEVKP